MKQSETPSPEQIAIEFTPVVNTIDGAVITSAWEFINMVFTHDKPYLGMGIRSFQPKGCEHPQYQVFTRNSTYVAEVVTYSLGDFAHAITKALELAWEIVSEDFSCCYGIWEDEKQLKALIEDSLCPEDAAYWQDLLVTLNASVSL
jgi:hypothetical protein